MNKKMLALYGLKWNPFASDVPVEALQLTPRIESFCWRVEQLAGGVQAAKEAALQSLLGGENPAGRHPLHRAADAHDTR